MAVPPVRCRASPIPKRSRSPALSGLEDNLRKWISGNDTFIPGTRMRHVAVTDKAKQDELIEFLKGLK